MSTPLGKSVITFGLAFLAGVVGACIGWLVTGFVADAILGVGGMSDINGGRAMVAFFTFGPIGAVAGLILGVWLVLRRRIGNWSFAQVAGYAAFIALLCVGIGAVYVGYLYLNDDILVHNGPSPILRFEIRLPPTATLPSDLDSVKVDLETDKNTMPGTLDDEIKTADGRKFLSGGVEVYFRTSKRFLVLRLPGQPDRLFELKLASNPKASAEYGPWQPLDYIDDDPNGQLRKAGADEGYEVRYRIERND
jgi:MFS family permease